MRNLQRAVTTATIAIGVVGCAPTEHRPLGGAWVEEYRGPVLAEAGGTSYRLLRKRLVGHRVVDEYISRPRYYSDGDCVIYERLGAGELRVVCGDGAPRPLLVEPRKFGEQGEVVADWELHAGGAYKKAPVGARETKCISLKVAKMVAGGGNGTVETCPASPDAGQAQ